MEKHERTIKGLECCKTKDCKSCPYKDEKDETYSGFCEHIMQMDCLELLKEQQRKKDEVLKFFDETIKNATYSKQEYEYARTIVENML